ncbi:MAG: sigma-54 dependent transcriptional regulator [Hyphomicrobiales bacterium]
MQYGKGCDDTPLSERVLEDNNNHSIDANQKCSHVLLVEDSFALSETYKAYLKSEGHEITCVETGQAAMDIIAQNPPDVAVLDVHLPDMNGIEMLKELRERDVPTDIIIITGQASVNLAVDAMREGAADFIMKPFTAERLRVTVRNATERRTLTAKIEKIQEELHRDKFVSFVGRSPAMQTVYQTLQNAAGSDATAFVRGESGTGKELCAEALHKLSGRKNGPLVTLNCAAIPRDLLESEIFGHVKGAFTGATRDRKGAAQRAHGGTLFLDEICEMDLSLQSKLLRFLQERTVQRVGDDVVLSTDVRIVCATNRDPMAEVQAGRFREDLFYRLHVVPIILPPLRDRGDDVLLIANHFLELFSAEDGKSFAGFAHDAEMALMAYHWPGNVRQLQNLVRNTVVMNAGGLIDRTMLPVELATIGQTAGPSALHLENPTLATMPMPIYAAPALPVDAHLEPMMSREASQQSPPIAYQAETGNPVTDQLIGGAYPVAKKVHEPYGQDEIHNAQPVLGGEEEHLLRTKTRADITALDHVIRETIEEAIRICDGSIPKAARALDVSPSTIYRRVQSWAAADVKLRAGEDEEAA